MSMPRGFGDSHPLAIIVRDAPASLGLRASGLLLAVLLAAFVPPALAENAESDTEPIVTSAALDNVLLAQQPKPAAKPAPAAPTRKTPAAPSKKPAAATTPPAPDRQPTPARADLSSDLGMLAYRSPFLRLASVPNMMGDFFGQGGQINVAGNANVSSDLPLAGGGSRLKIAENNKALPMNRVYLMYHHFHNALDSDGNTLAPGAEQSHSVDRFTFGLERTFLDGQWSVDVRIPFVGPYQFNPVGLGVEGGSIGDLTVALKRLLAAGPSGSLAAGLGVVTPTGSDVTGRTIATSFRVNNQAVHIAPYVGMLRVPNEPIFWQGFLQLDVPTNGNRVELTTPGSFGMVNDQTLLHADLSAGYWLYRNPDARAVTGIASLVELHYTSTLSDADVVTLVSGPDTFQFGNSLNRVDVTNATVGLHTGLFGNTTLRVSGVFPLQDNAESPFDAEINVSLNRYY